MWSSLNRLAELLSPKERWQAGLLVPLLLGNALLEMHGIGLVPVYIGILTEPERFLLDETVANLLADLNNAAEDLPRETLLYWGSGLLLGAITLKLIYTVPMAQLDTWLDGVLDATSLEELIGDESP